MAIELAQGNVEDICSFVLSCPPGVGNVNVTAEVIRLLKVVEFRFNV